MFVHRHNVCDTVDPALSDRPLFCNRKINTAKDFRKALIFMHDSVPCAKGFWSSKFGLEIDEPRTFVMVRVPFTVSAVLPCHTAVDTVHGHRTEPGALRRRLRHLHADSTGSY